FCFHGCDRIRVLSVTGFQTCALPISGPAADADPSGRGRLYRLRLLQVVEDRGGEGDLVLTGQRQRQVQLDEEVLEDAQRRRGARSEEGRVGREGEGEVPRGSRTKPLP